MQVPQPMHPLMLLIDMLWFYLDSFSNLAECGLVEKRNQLIALFSLPGRAFSHPGFFRMVVH